jgi:hypothetical protein
VERLLPIGLAALSWFVSAACVPDQTCDVDQTAQTLVGPDAKDCGHVGVGGDTKSVDACVIASFGAHQAFHARYDQQGFDSKVARVVVGDSSGRVFFLLWDSSAPHGTIDRLECLGPVVDSAMTRLDCTSSGETVRICQ